VDIEAVSQIRTVMSGNCRTGRSITSLPTVMDQIGLLNKTFDENNAQKLIRLKVFLAMYMVAA
jgi:hypothetical protein